MAAQQAGGHGDVAAVEDGLELLHGPLHVRDLQISRRAEAVEAYNELTAHAAELSPEAAQAVRSLRETLTSLVALGTAADLQIADMERTMEEFEAIFYSGDVSVSARLLRRHLTPEQRAELARLIIEP